MRTRRRRALHIASLGAEVTAWDIAPTAIHAARAAVASSRPHITFEVRDALDAGLQLAEPFDTWAEHTFFCALDPALRPRYVEAAARLLRPDGLLLGVFFIGDSRQGPPFAVTEPALRALLERHFRIERLAAATNSPGHWAGHEVMIVARAGQ